MLGSLRRIEAIENKLDKWAGPPRRELTEALKAQDAEYSKSFPLWLEREVLTVDEASGRVLPWPRKPHLQDAAHVLQAEGMVAIPKSRRMMVSWLCSAYGVWKSRYRPHGAAAIQADTESKAAFFVDQRCMFIERNLRTVQLRQDVKTIRTVRGLVGLMEYPNGSRLFAIAQGAEKIRAYTISLLIMDESEFQREGRDALVAAKPLIEKGMQIVLVSTSNGPSGVLAGICAGVGLVKWTGS